MKKRAKKRMQRQKEKMKSRTSPKTEEMIKGDVTSKNIVRLKVTVRKGARIESVPLKKLEKLATKKRKHWELKGEWLILNAF